MHKKYFFPAISLVSILMLTTLIFSSSAFAEKEILSPPTKVHNSEEARETVEDTSADTNLHHELSKPEISKGTEINAYIRKDGAEITEYSVKGKVYMVRVKPTANLPAYYLYDNNGDGVFEQKLPGGYKRPSPPMWVIKQF